MARSVPNSPILAFTTVFSLDKL